MKDVYLLIQTGYEGIENLCFLSEDENEILQKRKEFIDKEVEEDKRMVEWSKNEGYGTRELKKRQDIADFFCIQKWNGKKFDCVCNELGITTSKLMLR